MAPSDLVNEALDWADDGYIYVAGGGSKIYFENGNRIMSVSVTPGPELGPGLPVAAFIGPIDATNYSHSYDVMPGGDRLVWVTAADTDIDPAELRVVLGWGDEVRRTLKQ